MMNRTRRKNDAAKAMAGPKQSSIADAAARY
jgi:hypothetical protein